MFSINNQAKADSTTELLYLTEPALSCSGKILEALSFDGANLSVITDRSPFYVKGGGQKSDIGIIKSENMVFEVHDVRNENGSVLHNGLLLEGQIKIGEVVQLIVNATVRSLHTQLHTAGELICSAIKYLKYDWEVMGAIHYPERCSIDYNVVLNKDEIFLLQSELQKQLNSMIHAGSEVVIQTLSEHQEVVTACGYYPTYIAADEPIRVVTVWKGVVGRPCMGTHLQNINQLYPIQIIEIKTKKGTTSIKYQLA